MSLFEELKRRNVFRVGAAYAVAAWIVLQLLDVLGDIFELPPWGGKLIVLLVVVGFFLTLFFAWAFELTPEGVKRESEVDRTQSITPQTGRKLDRTIIGLLVLALGYFIWESRFMNRAGENEAPPPFATGESPEPTAQATAGTTPPEAEPISLADENAIAVLPFANRSLREEDSFFTEGIHDDLLTQLAKINNLKVVSRTSVMRYKDTEMSIPEIARQLRVGTILEGGVQRAGDRVRINVQLIDVNRDTHLWAETFDREMTVENIFDIQSEITRQIVQAVRGELSEEEALRLARVPTNDLQAYEAYLQALALTNRADYSQDNYQEAEVWATRAVELDPEFAQAWAMLVELHGQAVWIGYDTSPERYAAALEARDNARRLAPEAAETIAAEAEYAYRIEQDFPKAVELFQQAHRALPGDVDILHRLALAQRRTPDLDGALDSFRRTLQLDPNHARTTTTMSATLLSMGRLEEAERLIEQWMVTYPDARDLRAERVNAYLDRGEVELARNVINSMTPWVSAAYFTAVIEAPFLERDYRQAIEIWDSPAVAAMAENRGTVGLRETSRAQAYRLLGQMDDARAQARRAIELIEAAPPTGSYSDAFELLIKSYALLVLDRHDEALSAAEQARRDLPESRDLLFGSLVSSWRTRVLARAGHREQALAEIERLLEAPYRVNKWRLYLDPRWDFFRDDPRFNEMIRPDGMEQSGP